MWNIYNQSLPQGTAQEGAGIQSLSQAQSTLAPSADYWRNLLTGGRTQYAQQSAPAVDAALAQGDATRAQSSQFGSGRSGATVAANRDASTQTNSTIDNIINQNVVTGRQQGAQGLEGVAKTQAAIGSTQLSNALSELGLSQSSIDSILNNSSNNYQFDTQLDQQEGAAAGQAAAQVATALLFA